MNNIVLLSFVFALSELLLVINKRSVVAAVKTRRDRGSLIFLWLMITAGFTGGFYLSRPYNPLCSGPGLLLIIIGIIVRWAAIIQLGKSFTVDVAITDSAKLKTDGIYERVRHPSYSGLLLVVAGFSFAMGSVYSFAVLVLPVLIAVIYRIRVEEKVLQNEFGDTFLQYKLHTRKLIPGIF
jgi:protein-S-isoprenylcysteine O-methyltransferase Ste14